MGISSGATSGRRLSLLPLYRSGFRSRVLHSHSNLVVSLLLCLIVSALNESIEVTTQLVRAGAVGPCQSSHNHARASRKSLDTITHECAHAPLNAVAVRRPSDLLFWHNNADEGGMNIPGLAGAVMKDKPAAACAHTRLHCGGEILTPQHSVRGREHASGSQTRAALAAAGGQNGAAGAGRHARAEAVHLVATTVVRLESPLAHGCTPGRMIGTVDRGIRGTVARTGCPKGRE